MMVLDEIGVRHTGSYQTEVLTVDYLLDEIEQIKRVARDVFIFCFNLLLGCDF